MTAVTADPTVSVEETLPGLRARAEDTERSRQVPPESVQELIDTGLFAMFRPRAHGGTEQDVLDFFAAIRRISAACGATGWVASHLGITPWQVALFDPRAREEVWGERSDALVSSSYGPMGRLVPTEDGYRLSGSWRSAPAADYCSHILLGSLLIGQDGEPIDYTTALLPIEDCQLTGPWDVVGLRGAGSQDLVVEDVFVPAYRTFGTVQRRAAADDLTSPDASPLYRMPISTIHTVAVTMPLVGIVEGAFDYFLTRTRERFRLSHGGDRGGEQDVDHVALAGSLAEIDASVLQLERDLREQRDLARSNEPITIESRLRARRDQVRATERAVTAMDALLRISGGHGVQHQYPVQRAWRDVHTGAAHMANHAGRALSLYGQWATGRGVADTVVVY